MIKGDDSGGDTPLPIPNREVKPASADGTAGETLWESRSSPIFYVEPKRHCLIKVVRLSFRRRVPIDTRGEAAIRNAV